ncbi:MAG: sulfatase-like hydrolase/transferase [bacterium]|nr:sulfatase-like hydrolase/transferase [bacterium]
MPDQPNILVLHSDEHSFRFLSARSKEQGGEPCQTPTLDGLISQGVHLSNAYCQFPLCSPSRIAMLTGRHPHRCGAWSNGSILDPELPTFGSHFQSNGYSTATVGKMHIGGSVQYAGFGARPYGDFGGMCSHQYDPLNKLDGQDSLRSRTVDAGISEVPESLLQENMIARESLAWLRENRHANPEQPWLLYTSFSRPHFPLTTAKRFFDRYYPEGVTPPWVSRSGDSADHPMTVGAIKGFRTEEIEEEEMRKARAAYFGAVDFLDEMLGDFLALLEHSGFLDNTVIIYVADHGELVGEHGIWWKNTWHEASSHVPMIFSLPEHRNGDLSPSEITTPVSLADLFPTFCGLSGIAPPDGLDGVDLTDALKGETSTTLNERPGVITESLTPRWGEGTEFRQIRSDRYKYIAFRGCEDLAFDMQNDPDEQHNLLKNAEGDVAADLDRLKAAVSDGFDFDEVQAVRERDQAILRKKYPKRVDPKTPNQILLGDGRMVEADAPLYLSDTVSSNPAQDFEDFPT